MRDLHVDDLVVLIDEQLQDPEHRAGVTANVGGGRECSRSLLETTELCRTLTGNDVAIEPATETRPGDLPIYISDCNWLFGHTSWRPGRGPREILGDIYEWITDTRGHAEPAPPGRARDAPPRA